MTNPTCEKSPLVSVVIPTYKRVKTIDRCLKSILSQTFIDFEIIVVNDGPDDGTKEVINNLDDCRVRYLEHSVNRGQSAARNTGIKAARGKFIAFQDSDDEWLPSKLEKQVKCILSAPPGTGIVYTEKYNSNDGLIEFTPTRGFGKNPKEIRKELLKGSLITSQVAMVVSECFQKVGLYDESLRHLEDWDLWIRMIKYYDIINVAEPLAIIHTETKGISHDIDALIISLKSVIGKHYDEFRTEDDSLLGMHYYYLSRLLRKNGLTSESKVYLGKALEVDRLNFRYWLRYLEALVISKE